jgi:hypothetical protein
MDPTLGWQGRLNAASTAEDVAGVCRDFLEGWTAQDLADLPATCRPAEIVDSRDVSPYALKLIRRSEVGDRATAPLLRRMSTFFTRASLRLAAIAAEAGAAFSRPGNVR